MPIYNPNIPQPTDLQNVSQVDILGNFSSANTTMGINHYPFDNGTVNIGKHKFVDMPILAAVPTIASGDGGLYTKTATASQLFYTPDNSTNEYQMTRCISASFANFATNLAYGAPPVGFTQTGGWTFLPGGMMLQYGLFGKAGALGASGTIQFPVAYTNVPYSVTAILIRSSSASQSMSLPIVATTANFTFQSTSSSSDSVYWMAIGV